MIEGYSVKDAAQVLGIPEGRVWELVARGVLAGTQGPDGSWRIHLGQTRPPEPVVASATPDVRQGTDDPRREEGGGGGERSAFRELLTEFRNLTERYGQALLALGEARGEVASLRSRVELLESRVDLRLPGPAAAPVRASPEAAWRMADEDDFAVDDRDLESLPPQATAEPSMPDSLVPDSWAPAIEVDMTDPQVASPTRAVAPEATPEPPPVDSPQVEVTSRTDDVELGRAGRVVTFAPAPVPEPEVEAPPSLAEAPPIEVELTEAEELSPIEDGPQPDAQQAQESTDTDEAQPDEALPLDEPQAEEDAEAARRRRRASSTHNALAGLAEALARAVDPALDDLPGASAERRETADDEPTEQATDAGADEIEGADELEMAGSRRRPSDEPVIDEGASVPSEFALPALAPESEPIDASVEAPEVTGGDEAGVRQPPDLVLDDMGDDPFPDQGEITDAAMLRELLASGLPDDVEPFDWEPGIPDVGEREERDAAPADATATTDVSADEPAPGADEKSQSAPESATAEWWQLEPEPTEPVLEPEPAAKPEPEAMAQSRPEAEPEPIVEAPEPGPIDSSSDDFQRDPEQVAQASRPEVEEVELPGGDELRDALRALGIEGDDRSLEQPTTEIEDHTPSPSPGPGPARSSDSDLTRAPGPQPEAEARPPAGPKPAAGWQGEPASQRTAAPWPARPLSPERRLGAPGEPDWLRNRRDPAASAFRRLRRLFPK